MRIMACDAVQSCRSLHVSVVGITSVYPTLKIEAILSSVPLIRLQGVTIHRTTTIFSCLFSAVIMAHNHCFIIK
jgi:hypothetical protein